MRRAPRPIAFLSFNIWIAFFKFSMLSKGSPIPMNTMLESFPAIFCPMRNCSSISPLVRFRLKPMSAVRQKAQAILQPTWLDIQIVLRPSPSERITHSVKRPSESSMRSLQLPSSSSREVSTLEVRIEYSDESCWRRARGMLVIESKDSMPV